ncbi:hypothetical protein PO909_011645 [Leuciscus waleckii]
MGEFFSPRYPNNYPDYSQCTWTIHSTGNRTVSLTFTDVDLEKCCDYIRVYDGPSTLHPLLDEIREYRNQSLKSSNNDLTVLFYSDASVTNRGFHANWVFVESCGGNLTDWMGEFFSPRYPNNYINNARCTWTIHSTGNRTVSLTFTDVALEKCCDYIKVYDGPSTLHALLGEIREYRNQSFKSSNNDLTVLFYSDHSITSRGFHANWVFVGEESCGGNLTDSMGEFFSPRYPNNYPDYSQCTWTIHSTGNRTVSLTFTDVDLEKCCDYIRVYDGPSTLHPLLDEIREYRNQSLKSSNNDLTVLFYSDASVTNRGFHANWVFVESCGGNLTDWMGEFFSPRYPNNYINNARCTWTIHSTGNRTVSLTFTDVALEKCCDYIKVYDGPSTLHALLGEIREYRNQSFKSSNNDLTVLFYSDHSITSRGFHANWVFVGEESCGGNLTDSMGEFFSPRYPNNYPDYSQCTWTIHSTGNRTVSLTFTDVDLEKCCDYIRVYDGPSTLHPLLDEIREYRNQSLKSSNNDLTVLFYSDASVTNRGFHANWVFVESCGGNLTDWMGEFFSPRYPNNYINNARCTWTIHSTGNRTVSLTFTDVALEKCCDYIKVYDGPSTLHALLGEIREYRNQSFKSSNNDLTVLFYSDHSITSRGFHANWVFVGEESCGGNLTDSMGEFFSPRYPNNYPDYSQCTWTIHSTGNRTVSLTFTDVDLEKCCDYIRVYDGPSTLHPLLDEIREYRNQSLKSSNNDLTVLFYSDASVTRRGFHANWVFVVSQPQCGGHLYESGVFSSPNYPNYYHDNAYCVWYISAQQGQRIFLSFADVQLERCCNCDYISIHDGSSTGHSQLGKVCFNDTTNQVFHSSSRYLTVVFRSDYSGVSHGFKAHFTSSLTADEGHVNCSSDNMVIVIQRNYLNSLGLSGNDLYVDDNLCRPTINSTEVVFSFPLDTCGTAKEMMNGYVSYTNNVRASQSQSGEITRQSQFLLHVGCRMEPDIMVQIFYKARENINANITGTGRFNASIAFYTSSSFYQQIYDSPYEVNLNQPLYAQVKLNRPDKSLDLFLDTCVASPNPTDFKDRSYDLLRNGCPRDNTYYSYTSGQHYYARFSFQAFKFLRTHAYVYLQCKVIICPDNDYNSRCRQGCRFRRKRSLDSTYHTNTVTLGPIKLSEASSRLGVKESEKSKE